MSTISEQSKFKSYNFWVKMVSAVVLILRIVLNKFGYELDSAFVLDIATLVAGVLVILGIINEPTGVTVSFNENVEGDGVEGNSSEVLKEKVKEKLSEVESIFTSFGASDKSAIKKRLDDIDNFIVGILDGEENSINSLNALINGNGGDNLNADRENGECVEEQIEKVAQIEMENATEEGLDTLSTTEEGLEVLNTTEEGLEAFNLSEAKESGCEIEAQNDELGEQIKEVEVQGEGIANCNNMAEEFDDGNKANSNLETNQIQGVDEGQTEGLVCQTEGVECPKEGRTEVVVCQNGVVELPVDKTNEQVFVDGEQNATSQKQAENETANTTENENATTIATRTEAETATTTTTETATTTTTETANTNGNEITTATNINADFKNEDGDNRFTPASENCELENGDNSFTPASGSCELGNEDAVNNSNPLIAECNNQAELCSLIGKTNQVDATIATDEQNIETPHFTALDVVKCIEDQLCGEDAEQKSKFAEKIKDIILSNLDELVG